MGMIKRALRPGLSFFDRRVDWRVDRKLERYARQDDLNAVSDGLTKVYRDLLEATTDVRRWLADDLDAAQETTALLGRSLTRLSDAVERLGDEIAGLSARCERIEAAMGVPSSGPGGATAAARAGGVGGSEAAASGAGGPEAG